VPADERMNPAERQARAWAFVSDYRSVRRRRSKRVGEKGATISMSCRRTDGEITALARRHHDIMIQNFSQEMRWRLQACAIRGQPLTSHGAVEHLGAPCGSDAGRRIAIGTIWNSSDGSASSVVRGESKRGASAQARMQTCRRAVAAAAPTVLVDRQRSENLRELETSAKGRDDAT